MPSVLRWDLSVVCLGGLLRGVATDPYVVGQHTIALDREMSNLGGSGSESTMDPPNWEVVFRVRVVHGVLAKIMRESSGGMLAPDPCPQAPGLVPAVSQTWPSWWSGLCRNGVQAGVPAYAPQVSLLESCHGHPR